MTHSQGATALAADPMEESVAAWLRDHPDFLADRPDLYRVLSPPRRVHGERLADHMAAMLAAERLRARALEAEVTSVIAAGRASAGFTVRIRLAVLALMRAQDVVEAVTQELPALLGLETCSLCAEPSPPRAQPGRGGLLPLPKGTVARLIGRGRDAVIRTTPTDLDLLHAEAAPLVQRDALARVPVAAGGPMLLALGARDPTALPTRQATPALAFLGRAVAAALAR